MSIDQGIGPSREVEVDEDVTLGDIDVDLDAVKGAVSETDHPYEVDTRADAIVIAHDRGERLHLETIGVEAAWHLISQLELAADIAGQYDRSDSGIGGGD